MKLKKKLFRIYIVTVVIPIILITGMLSFYQYRRLVENRFEYAKSGAKFLSEVVDSFVVEIISDLELLANLIDEKDESYIQSLLTIMGEKYPYPKEFFYTNTDRVTYLASNRLTEFIDIHFRSYFNAVMETGETALFFVEKSALNDYTPLIKIATPVFRNEEEVSGVLIGEIPPHSILDHSSGLDRTINYILGDNVTNTNILDTIGDSSAAMTASKPLAWAPWTVFVNVESVPGQEIITRTLIIFFICLLITHLLYFIIRFFIKLFYEKKYIEEENQKNAMKKLELVGTLAGSFAHEVRNPLTGIKGFISLLKEKHSAEEDQMYFSVIETELTRINNIVEEFLIIGKPITVNQKTYDIRDILQEVYPIIESEAHHSGVSTKIELADERVLLFCTKDHIKQLVLNLAKNAIQASQAGDEVIISANKNKDFIFISVSDSGSGISDEAKETLFDPFFTTKEEGTGLGLIVCKQIVDMYHATIEVESTLNVGTTFLISFPIKKK